AASRPGRGGMLSMGGRPRSGVAGWIPLAAGGCPAAAPSECRTRLGSRHADAIVDADTAVFRGRFKRHSGHHELADLRSLLQALLDRLGQHHKTSWTSRPLPTVVVG